MYGSSACGHEARHDPALYTAVNVSLAVWLLKGFIDEIPREYEEAAMIDGYSRMQAFWKELGRRPSPALRRPPSSA